MSKRKRHKVVMAKPDGASGGSSGGSGSGGGGGGGGGGTRRSGVFTISKKTHPLPKIDVEPATIPETSPTVSICETSGSKVTYSQVRKGGGVGKGGNMKV